MCSQTTLKLFIIIILGWTGILDIFMYVHKIEETSQQQDNGSHLKNIILQKCVKCNLKTSNGVVLVRESRWWASTGQAPCWGGGGLKWNPGAPSFLLNESRDWYWKYLTKWNKITNERAGFDLEMTSDQNHQVTNLPQMKNFNFCLTERSLFFVISHDTTKDC